ncbi:MAG: ATP synthase subunit C [Gammaproteobacteria bacterium]|jgi:V/A-type H+-transporting ATPase subunit K
MQPAQHLKITLFAILATSLLVALASVVLWLPEAFAAAPAAGAVVDPVVMKWGFAAAAASTGVSALAAGYAVAMVGSAGMGALAERPELLGRVLVLVGLAEGIAIYGLIVSILILDRLG